MKRTSGLLVVVALGAALVVSAAGCRRGAGGASDPSSVSFVPVTYEDYRPDFGQSLAHLKGKKVRLMDFTNRADDTQMSSYFSTDKNTTYGNPNSGFGGIGGKPLESYFWYSYKKALDSLGMAVSTSGDPADPAVPSLAITLKSVTDQQFVLLVDVTRPGTPAVGKTITISEPPPPATATAAELSARAYKMMTMSVMAVLQDPDVSGALSK